MKQIGEIADFRQIFVDAAQNTRQYNKISENEIQNYYLYM